jgi:hypothetical protein
MPHTFTVTLNEELSETLKKVESAIVGNGGIFQGDAEKGSFASGSILGAIKGEYRCLTDKEIRITITDKPFLVPHSKIESEIKRYFS